MFGSYARTDGGARGVPAGDEGLVHTKLRRADGRAGAGLARDREREERPDPGPDGLGEDARGVPLGDRPADSGPRGRAPRPLRLAPQGAQLRRRAESPGPLAGLRSELKVAVRTGDTPQKERAAMLREPPDILITTPESLFLLLTSRARELLRSVDTLILDEVHAVAGTKRGAHLALSVERLEALAAQPLQR